MDCAEAPASMECGPTTECADTGVKPSVDTASVNTGVKSYQSLLEEGLIELVIHRASEEEVTCAKVSVDTYKCLLAAYLIKGDYDQARLLWLRLPSDVRKNPDIQSLWGMGKAMIKSDHSSIYSSTSPYKHIIISRYRERTLEGIALVYNNISVPELGLRLGCGEVEVAGSVAHLGWKVEAGWVMPVRGKEVQREVELKLSELANYVSFLENI